MPDFFNNIAQQTLGLVPILHPMTVPIFSPSSGLVGEGVLIEQIAPAEEGLQHADIAATTDDNHGSGNQLDPVSVRQNIPESSLPRPLVRNEKSAEKTTSYSKPTSQNQQEFMANNSQIPDRNPAAEEKAPTLFSEIPGSLLVKMPPESKQGNADTPSTSKASSSHEDRLLYAVPASISKALMKEGYLTQDQTEVKPIVENTQTVSNVNHNAVHFYMRHDHNNGAYGKHTQPAANIKVTIGRVDVRANFPTPKSESVPAPTRPSTTGPTLSLDDYLKKRNEEVR